MHEHLRQHALAAWEAIQRGEENPLTDLILQDSEFKAFATEVQLNEWMDVRRYLGDAPRRAKLFAGELRTRIAGMDR
jgi:adenylosuccinate lyase